ncbi:AIG2-like family protein [Symmachiella macrocystis]|uniref:AIG2-like family protein n=1 Tax=Symmachiella macrocystis TaxID=2527985 RepID=A0A5C6BSP6_9PLAN|nr:gamma-glutamylcyclotransferase family protein [Symmachiella macrocystis]TWU14762.1 AIG2-like family protein [Symmachiella macrocystis]
MKQRHAQRDLQTAMQIFAYGSNMHTARLRARVASAVPVGLGVVAQRQFVFHKRGLDGSGKADAFYTGVAEDRVWGVLFEIAAADKPVLDEFESVGVGYDDLTVTVELAGGTTTEAVIYAARAEMLDAQLKPFCWYREFVLQGGRQHGLPADYLVDLAQFESIRDADAIRREKNWRLSRTAGRG